MTSVERSKSKTRLHLLFIVGLSCLYESLFVAYGVNPLDDSWPIYAIWNLDNGGTLFEDVLWVFPPGHLLGAWLGVVLDPPGLTISRAFYAGFNVALVFAFYALGRHFMSATFAFIAAS